MPRALGLREAGGENQAKAGWEQEASAEGLGLKGVCSAETGCGNTPWADRHCMSQSVWRHAGVHRRDRGSSYKGGLGPGLPFSEP